MTESSPAGQPTRKEREFAQHHQEILDAAESLFAEKGYYQSTMQMVADRAEFSVGYLYKHFGGKEELYQEMVRYHLGRLDELTAEVEAQDLSPLEEIHRTYQEICRHFNSHRDFMRIFHEGVAGDFCELSESKNRHFEDIRDKLVRAQEAGELKPFDPGLLAAAMQGATKELFGELAERPGENPFDDLPDVLFAILIDPQRK